MRKKTLRLLRDFVPQNFYRDFAPRPIPQPPLGSLLVLSGSALAQRALAARSGWDQVSSAAIRVFRDIAPV